MFFILLLVSVDVVLRNAAVQYVSFDTLPPSSQYCACAWHWYTS